MKLPLADNKPSNIAPASLNESHNNTSKQKGDGWLSIIFVLAGALLVAFLLTAFVFQQYEVDGPSMEPTLQNANRLVVIKTARTWSRITGHPYIPQRGNIIIFTQKISLDTPPGYEVKQLVKRVVALPGDHLVINNGVITIYNKQHPNGYDPDKTMNYLAKIPVTTGYINMVIPANEVFVCGDNRTDSLDSRYFGPVQVKNIIGKLDLRVYPFNEIRFF